MIQADVIASSKFLEKQPGSSSMKILVNVVALKFLNSSIQLEFADLTRNSFIPFKKTLLSMQYRTYTMYIIAFDSQIDHI